MTPTPPVVLVTEDWPRGFCPLHFPNHGECASWCLPLRQELAQVQLALRDYWTDEGLLRA